MAVQTNTLSAALAALMASSSAANDSFIPFCDSSGNVTGKIKVSDLVLLMAGLALSTPRDIPKDSNLNDYFAPGVYSCNGSNAATLQNRPYDNLYGFTMLCIGISNQYTTQVLFSRMGVYMRFQTNPWKQIYTFLT